MDEQNERPAHLPQGGQGPGAEEVEVRVTMEQTRQALEASAAEIERSKRLLRETEELVQQPVASPPEVPSDEGTEEASDADEPI